MAVSITSISPLTGPVGTIITIIGSGFTTGPGTSVQFIGSLQPFDTIWCSPTYLTAAVPSDAQSGPLTVSSPNGFAVSTDSFTVTNQLVNVGPPIGPPTSLPRQRGPYYAVTSLPTEPETWWVVTDGADSTTVYNNALGILRARFSTVPQQFQSPEYLDEQTDMAVCTKAMAMGKVGAAGMQEYERLNPLG